jgi:adenylate kinase family enzyme
MRIKTLYNHRGVPHDRYVVVGTSGSGKSTLADKLAWRTDNRHIELDALFWLPDWRMRPTDEFRRLVAEATAGPRWVVDGNYSIARDVAWSRAEAVVWLDLPFHVVMAQVIKRTLDRCITGRPLWNGNRASFRRAFLNRDSSIIWWAAKTWKERRDLYSTLLYEPKWLHLDIFRIRSTDMTDVDVRRGPDD